MYNRAYVKLAIGVTGALIALALSPIAQYYSEVAAVLMRPSGSWHFAYAYISLVVGSWSIIQNIFLGDFGKTAFLCACIVPGARYWVILPLLFMMLINAGNQKDGGSEWRSP
jgi:hypothetical protein